jgi:hypothetical protein
MTFLHFHHQTCRAIVPPPLAGAVAPLIHLLHSLVKYYNHHCVFRCVESWLGPWEDIVDVLIIRLLYKNGWGRTTWMIDIGTKARTCNTIRSLSRVVLSNDYWTVMSANPTFCTTISRCDVAKPGRTACTMPSPKFTKKNTDPSGCWLGATLHNTVEFHYCPSFWNMMGDCNFGSTFPHQLNSNFCS